MLPALAADGHEVRLSTDAGAYLCEETLYSLESLKAEGRIPAAVSFCHVPPLGARSSQGPVTAGHVQQFVEDYLDAWQAMTSAAAQVRGQSPDPSTSKIADSKQKQEVREFIDRYFRSWSNQDMDRYGQCFMPQAAIQLIDDSWPTPYDAAGAVPAKPGRLPPPGRQPHDRDARIGRNPLRGEPRPRPGLLEARRRPAHEYGYDHFTLMKSDGKWRIANLVFYTTPAPKASRPASK